MFLAVNENIDYCDVQFNDETYVEAVRRGRQAAAIKGRQPIKEILIEGNSVTEKTLIPVREEINDSGEAKSFSRGTGISFEGQELPGNGGIEE